MAVRTISPGRPPTPAGEETATQALGSSGGAADEELDQTVSFPELVWAHFQRQQELLAGDGLHAEAEHEYRRRLKIFKQEQGDILNAYWCRYEASGAAVTQLKRRYPRRPWRRDSILRFHTATDWRSHEAPEVAELLHVCETLAIRVGEVLRGTSERIALQWILAVASRLLGAVDQAKEEPPPNVAKLNAIIKAQRAELREVERYYHRAGQKSARLVYFGGMMRGVALLVFLSGLVLLALWPAQALHPHQARTQDLFAVCAMGALGAVVSVMSRMATAGRFRLDHEVGRKSIRRLGSFRPFIGAIFALVLYFALKSDLLEIGSLTKAKTTIYFYATLAFLAGFSERWAKVILEGSVGGGEQSATHSTTRDAGRQDASATDSDFGD